MADDKFLYGSSIAGSTGYTTTVAFASGASAMPSAAAAGFKTIEVPQQVKMFKVRTDLPESHLRLIGKVMLSWAHQEWVLQQVMFMVSTGDPKLGRIFVGFPRSEDAINRIEQWAEAHSIALKTDTGTLKKAAKKLEKYRDQVGHGIWIKDDADRWCAIVYSGNWEAGEWQGTPKRVTPHAKPIDESDLSLHIAEIEQSTALTRALFDEIAGLLPSLPQK